MEVEGRTKTYPTTMTVAATETDLRVRFERARGHLVFPTFGLDSYHSIITTTCTMTK